MKEKAAGSFYTYHPRGCRLCSKGAKMVLFITGLCGRKCFYCPVSAERMEKDVIFANEQPVKSEQDALLEAQRMGALGTGITGGEPLLRLSRVLTYIRLLKSEFGQRHHIHLYTSVPAGRKVLGELAEAGLDEIRFHPAPARWKGIKGSRFMSSLRTAMELGMDAGFEVPALGGAGKLANAVSEVGGFFNLNELEFSETNAKALYEKGYTLRDDASNAASGSREAALEALRPGARIHFCSSRFKDSVQLRERLKRTAKNMARRFDEITEDGTLVYGVIGGCAADLHNEFGVPRRLYEEQGSSIELAWWVLDEIAGELKRKGCTASIVERYPIIGGMKVEVTPL